MLAVIGVLTFILQICLALWENRMKTVWQGVHTKTTLWQIFTEWAVYMVLFIALSLVLRTALQFAV